MIREDLLGLVDVNLPRGYSLRHFCLGDEIAWEAIISNSFGQENTYKFDILMKQDPCYKPQRVLFICFDNHPVATASAWYMEKYGPDFGYIHMVGVLSSYQGKSLGYWISLACLHYFVRENRKKAILQTDDFRLAAIKTYLNLGFKPHIVDDGQINRWSNIFNKINFNEKKNINECD
jgi:mycothiol synthase